MRFHTLLALPLLGMSVLWTPLAKAAPQDLGPWRALTPEEEKARIGGVPSASADRSQIAADFDGDGAKDKALIAIRRTDGARALIAVVKGRVHVLVLSGENRDGTDADKSDLQEASLRVAAPGSWQPNCYEDGCTKRSRRAEKLKTSGILLYDGPSTMLYGWDPKAKRFSGTLMVH